MGDVYALDADDDANPANDGWVSGVVEAPELAYTEGVENNSSIGPTGVPLFNVSTTGVVMDPYRYVRINGTLVGGLVGMTLHFITTVL